MIKQWWQLDGIDALEESERFERRLAELAKLPPKEKAKAFKRAWKREDVRAKEHDFKNREIEAGDKWEMGCLMEEAE